MAFRQCRCRASRLCLTPRSPSAKDLGHPALAKDAVYSFSKKDLARPDWRMMLWRVPRLSGSWIGTGTVTVVPSVLSCIMRWLPCWRTATKPCCSRILQTSEPERTLSLPNGHLNLRDEDLTVKPLANLLVRGCLEEEREGFDEISARFLDG